MKNEKNRFLRYIVIFSISLRDFPFYFHIFSAMEHDSSEDSDQFEPPRAPVSSIKIECQCGTNNTNNRLIKCVGCAQWQHAVCMGVRPTDCVTAYKCEDCEPRLLIVTIAEAEAFQGVKPPEPTPAPKIERKTTKVLYIQRFLDFLSDKSENIKSPLPLTKFFQDYKTKSNCSQSLATAKKKLLANLFEHIVMSAKYNDDRKAEMLFAIGLRVEDEFLERFVDTSSHM